MFMDIGCYFETDRPQEDTDVFVPKQKRTETNNGPQAAVRLLG